MTNILLIEDDVLIAQMYIYILKKNGFTMDNAFNGATGFEKIKNNQYDLILLDIMLPDLNGVQILEEVRKEDIKTPPILLLSNLTQESIINRCLTLGAIGYILKSNIVPSDLVTLVKKYLPTDKIPSPQTSTA